MDATINNETNINPIKRHCCLWLTFWILNNTHNAPLLSRGLCLVTFDLPGTCWIQIKCRFVLLRLNKLNPSTHGYNDGFVERLTQGDSTWTCLARLAPLKIRSVAKQHVNYQEAVTRKWETFILERIFTKQVQVLDTIIVLAITFQVLISRFAVSIY